MNVNFLWFILAHLPPWAQMLGNARSAIDMLFERCQIQAIWPMPLFGQMCLYCLCLTRVYVTKRGLWFIRMFVSVVCMGNCWTAGQKREVRKRRLVLWTYSGWKACHYYHISVMLTSWMCVIFKKRKRLIVERSCWLPLFLLKLRLDVPQLWSTLLLYGREMTAQRYEVIKLCHMVIDGSSRLTVTQYLTDGRPAWCVSESWMCLAEIKQSSHMPQLFTSICQIRTRAPQEHMLTV